MNVKSYLQKGLLLAAFLMGKGECAPPSYSYRPPQPVEDPIRQIRTSISELKNEVRNHESEIRVFEEKLHNQENIVDNLRESLQDSYNAQRDQTRAQQVDMDRRLETLNNAVQGLISDLKQIKSQANDSVTALGQYKQKLNDLEMLIEAQNQHMKGLESALNSVMELMQAKTAAEKTFAKPVSGEATRTYQVQSGDSLEKIARQQKVTIQSIRDYNSLTNDKIRVGQILKIPPN